MAARHCQACGRPLAPNAHHARKYCEHGCDARRCVDCGTSTSNRWVRCQRCAVRRRWAPNGESLLTPRELAVLQGVAAGLTNRQIGRQLYVSHKTVEGHLYEACRKLGVHGRAAAVAEAMRRELIE